MSMRILMTLDAVGGVWRYAMDLGTALRRQGHRIVLAGQGPLPSASQRAEAAAIGPLEWGDAPLDWMAASEADLDGSRAWLDGLVRRHTPDILHLNQPSHAVGRLDGPPCVAVTHSCLSTWFRTVEDAPVPEHMAWQARLTAQGLRDATTTIAPSHAHAEQTAEAHVCDMPETVPNASRAPLRRPSAGDGTALAAARWWDPGKGGSALDDAAARTRTPVVMIGACAAPDGQRFMARHAATPGALSYQETLKRVAAASVFISPSRYEPFGLAALEAARAARPLLLADIPVYREIWEGAARFFDPDDPEALAAGIDAFMQSEPDRMKLGVAAQRRALAFSPWAQARAMETLYRKALAQAAVN